MPFETMPCHSRVVRQSLPCCTEESNLILKWFETPKIMNNLNNEFSSAPEEVGHGPKGIMVGRISESRTLFYRSHEINMAGF